MTQLREEVTDGRLPTLECDLVMKGGISSGIVYPRAVTHLARRYRFRRVGGTSAGAIAAVAAAAAEYGRADGGFTKLEALPNDLGKDMRGLFQSAPATRPVFHLLLDWLEPGWSRKRKVLSTALRLVKASPVLFAVSLGAVLLLGVLAITLEDAAEEWALVITVLLWLALVALVKIAALAWAAKNLVLRTLDDLPRQGFGMCDGHSREPGVDVPPLTDWMHRQFQDLGGRTEQGPPLTFGDLWGAEAVAAFADLRAKDKVVPRQWREAAALRQIDLEVMTTNVTLGRPYLFPFRDRIFYFCADRLRTYFPDVVVDHLVAVSREAEDIERQGTVISMRCPCHGHQVRSMPEPQDLPVLLAARISLSFPILLSALPLFCVDWDRAPGKQGLIENWFSDGGISSNFPMHLFDSPLPSRPTYGFNLGPAHPDYGGLVWAPPEAGRSGLLPRSQQIVEVKDFLRSVLNAMQNWNDNTRITMPGYRDRVAIIRQKEGEGGMNLAMEPHVIEDLANRGGKAAALFDGFDLDLHKWVRYRVSMAATDEHLSALHTCYQAGFGDYLTRYRPIATKYDAVAADETATTAVLAAAQTLADENHPATRGTVPSPVPDLRVTPRL